MKEECSEGRVDRKLAVGWFDNAPFRAICQKYVPRIKEVFFAWPGVTYISAPGHTNGNCIVAVESDGLRPVYFKLEATDREAGPFLGRD